MSETEIQAVETSRSQRRLKNFLIYPRGQIRFLFGIPVIAMLVVAALFFQLKSTLLWDLEQLRATIPGGAARIIEFEQSLRSIFSIGIVCATLSAVMITLLGLTVTHHFYGPLVPILRKIENMKQGKFYDPIHLRKEDELKELASSINDLSEVLKKLSK